MNAPFDFFAAGELSAPAVDHGMVVAWAHALGAPGVDVHELGSQQDANFLLTRGGGPFAVLKVTNPAFDEAAVRLQDEAAARVGATAGLRTPIRRRLAGDGLLTVPIDGPGDGGSGGGRATVRLIEHLGGGTLHGSRYLRPAVVARLGAVCAGVASALTDLENAHLDAALQWNLQHAARLIDLLADHLPDPALVRATAAESWAVVERVAPDLPVQAIHGDLTDDNVVLDASGLPDGVIDFGDVMRSWRVAELAVAISSVLHHDGATAADVLPAVVAYDARLRLTESEIEALWPLVVLRACTLVASGHQQAALDPDNVYVTDGLTREVRILEVATAQPAEVMTAVIRQRLGRPVAPRPVLPPGLLLPAGTRPAVVDLSVTSPLMDAGGWLRPTAEVAAGTGADVVVWPAGPDATAVPALAMDEPASVDLRAGLWTADPLDLVAPWDGTLSVDGATGSWCLEAPDVSLVFDGDVTSIAAGAEVSHGSALLRVHGVVRVGTPSPGRVPPSLADGWLAVRPDPGPLLGLPVVTPTEPDLLLRRAATLAGTQEHYYDDPPRIERGWRHHLLSTAGRSYLDILNNVTVLGHGRPELAAAVADQWRTLNTNSRFHYGAIVDVAERLAGLLPDPLDTVYLVNSGSEAVDLALRLAIIATGRPDLVAVREAYHGWTYLSDAVSTSVADNPRALETRPGWVHTVDAPNSYRGRYRGADAERYAGDAVRVIEDLVAAGTPPAAFIAEPYYGNAGGIALPDGYLRQVYAAVRDAGGLAIADEIQVGLGRLGHWFWGFEQQQVVPDIVVVAKALGNGHPVAAVVTTAAIAGRYADAGYFFSSTGGSPVSSVVGSTVLDLLRSEDLPGNARRVGARLHDGLVALQRRHQLIGAVHGSGLYVGVEFVRDRDSLEPATAETALICERMLRLGVIVQATGDHQNILKIKPPLCLDARAADYFVAALDRALTTGW